MKTPKFKIGETVEAHWAGGHTTRHVITGISENHHGFWYTWDDNNCFCSCCGRDGFGCGLHEKHIRKVYTKDNQEGN